MKISNLCLKWSDFEENIREYFKGLRERNELFDVTIACSEGTQIQVHKSILSAGSLFFNDILMNSSHPNTYIYLRGVKNAEILNLIHFLYNGEVFVSQEEFKDFLDTAQDLKIKGLLLNNNEAEDCNTKFEFDETFKTDEEGIQKKVESNTHDKGFWL